MRRLDFAEREEKRVSEGAKGTWGLRLKKDDVMRANWRVEGADGKGIWGKKWGDLDSRLCILYGMLCRLPPRMFIRCNSPFYSLPRQLYPALTVYPFVQDADRPLVETVSLFKSRHAVSTMVFLHLHAKQICAQ